ncbi:hypothetical protein CMI40_01480 [Candidatus Pacearchaeota archaeon]|jgi:hypothetical protein|nr:hypothetical protein [Candidatus Pacearchaeota archaeon]
MINGLISLASYSFYGGEIGNLLSQWEQMGFFSYLLPFLLIFALVFGILTQIKLFQESKSINGILSLVVGLMALQFDFVPRFFSEIFPRLGVGLAIILGLLILVGIFIDPSKGWIMSSLLGIGVIIFIIVLVQTSGATGWYAGAWWFNNWPTIAAVIFILAVIGIIVGGSQEPEGYQGFWPGAGGPQKKL